MPPLPGLPEGVVAQVRPRLKETTGFVLASTGECLDLQRREIQTIKNRVFRPLRPDDLPGLRPPSSWLLGVLRCPGDTTEAVAQWASRSPTADRTRVRFYLYGSVDADQAMRAWNRLGLGPVAYVNVSTWKQFHHRFGADHAVRVYQDHVQKR